MASAHKIPTMVLVIGCAQWAACSEPPAPDGGMPELTVVLDATYGASGGPGALSSVFDVDVDRQGNVFVSEPEFGQVMVFAADGQPLVPIGRRGEGPGEFQFPGNLSWLGDTLAVLDFQRGIQLMGTEGEYFDRISFRIEGEGERFAAVPMFPLADGSIVSFSPALAGEVVQGRRTVQTWLKVSRHGVILDTLAHLRLPGTFYSLDVPGDHTRTGAHPLAFSEMIAVPPDGSSLVLVDQFESPDGGVEYSLVRVDLDGDTLHRRAIRVEPRTVTASASDSISLSMATRWSRGDEQAANRMAGFVRERLPWPTHHPPVAAVLAGSDGVVWVRRSLERDDLAQWTIFDRELTPVGDVYLPRGVELKTVSLDTAYGVVLDELDVPWVVRYRVSAPK